MTVEWDMRAFRTGGLVDHALTQLRTDELPLGWEASDSTYLDHSFYAHELQVRAGHSPCPETISGQHDRS